MNWVEDLALRMMRGKSRTSRACWYNTSHTGHLRISPKAGVAEKREERNMQSDATSVSQYIEEAPEERRAALIRLRELCLRTLVGFEESMTYGGPTYARDGEIEVGFASQKNFIGLYILRTDVMEAHRHLLNGRGISVGKGAIRYSRPERIDFQVVEQMLRATAESTGPICD